MAGHRNFQFSLQHLFELTTLAAIAAALATTVGPGTLTTSTGIFLAWLNLHGAFESMQVGRKQTAVLGLSWTTFLVSMALPSVTIFGPVYGFNAAWFAIVGPIESLLGDEALLPIGIIVYLVVDIANVLMLLLPLLIWRLSQGHGHWLSAALCVAMVAPWCVAWDAGGDLLFGYYLWCVSFGMALVANRIPGRVFIAMLAMAIGLALIIVLGK
jgi:hypothetical protein